MSGLADTIIRLATEQNPRFEKLDTILGILQHNLYALALTEDMVLNITRAMMADKATDSMQGRWLDKADHYPPQLLAVAWVVAFSSAKKWLKENHPQHWVLPVLEGPAPSIIR